MSHFPANTASIVVNAPVDPVRKIAGAPPNMGQFLVPQVATLSGLSTSLARAYRPSDEALKHALDNARYMRNDVGLMECIEARQRSCALLDWHLEPEDAKSPMQRQLCEDLTKILRRIPRFTQYRENLLHAVWFGRYAIQHRYQWKMLGSGMRVLPTSWKPIHGDKLVFRIDDGSHDPDQVGIRVGQTISLADTFGIPRSIEPTERGMAYFLQPHERRLLAIHRHMIEDGEFETPENADRVNGVGIRSKIYWEWFQKQQLLSFLLEYLERSAFGIEIWYYPLGNDDALEKTKQAASERIGEGRNVIFVGKPLGDDAASYGVDRIEPGLAGCESLKDILDKYFGHRIKRYILGQTLTSEADATGLGSGLAELHLGTYLDIVKYDATNLEETLTTDLVAPLKLWNHPEADNVHIRFVVETETQEAEKKLQSFQTAWQMGARIKESDVMDAIGASIPTEADRVLQSPQSQGGGMPPGAASMFGQAGFGPGKQQQPEAPESKSDGVKEDQTEQYAAQKRAKQGGETGANGEWYEGGQFIATTQHAKVPQAEKKRGTGKQEIEPYKWEVGPDGHRSIFKAISGVFGRLGDARRGQDPEKMYLRDDEGLPQSLQHFGVDLEDAKKLVDLFNSGERWYRSHPGNSWKIASDSDVEQYAKREWHEDQHSRDKNGEFSRKSESGETASAGGDPEDDQLSHLSSEDRQVVDYVANMLFMKEMNVSDAVKHLKSKGKDLGMETAWAWNQLKEQSRQRVREGKRAKRESAGDVPQKESSATNSDPQSQRKSLLDAVDSHGPHAIISAAELRKSLSHVFPTKEAFDNAVMDLAGDGVMNLHWYDHKMSDQEREDFIQGDNGLYYNAMNRRSSSYSRETEDLEQYARKKSKFATGQKSLMWSEEDHPRDEEGKFTEKDSPDASPSGKKHTDDEWNEAQSNYDHLLATKGRGHELTQAAKKRLAEMYENDLKSDAPQGSQDEAPQASESEESSSQAAEPDETPSQDSSESEEEGVGEPESEQPSPIDARDQAIDEGQFLAAGSLVDQFDAAFSRQFSRDRYSAKFDEQKHPRDENGRFTEGGQVYDSFPERLISSQRYLDEDTVESKLNDQDFDVLVSPPLMVDGEMSRVILDGHHSLEAAKRAGVSPNYKEASLQDCDSVGFCDTDPEHFLDLHVVDGQWYDHKTGLDIW